MTINDLFVMFAEKSFRKNVNIIHKKIVSFVLRQIIIISYFKSVDSSKIKSFKFDVFISNFSSTSIKFASINQIAEISRYYISASKCFVFIIYLNFSHICRFCHETFTFNNNFHRHLRLIHLISKSNRSFEDSILHDRNMISIKSFVFREHTYSFSINNSSFQFYRHYDASF